MDYIGIDVSKEHFDVYNVVLGNRQFTNDRKGFMGFKKWLGALNSHCVMEASGPYYLSLATWLFEAGVVVSVVNPLVIRRFCQMNLQRTKTDKKDAQAISHFGSLTNPPAWKPAVDDIRQIRQLFSVLEQLSRQLTSTRNAQGALVCHPKVNENALAALKRVEKVQQVQVKTIEQQINKLMQEHFGEQINLLKSIPGIGSKTAVMLIAITDGFTKFNHYKQLVSYIGLTPRIFQSGKTVNRKPHITKMGMSEIRRLLFMCSFQAKERNLGCKQLYERLRKAGKAAKVALVAVANKLIRQAFAVATKRQTFNAELLLA
jgi:transposase